jgi:hypothetical protein
MAARKPSINKAERELIEELRKHPEMFERFQEIMPVASEPSGDPLKTADRVDEMLIEEMRRLGKCTMENWAMNAESKVAQELKADHPKVQQRKKKR